MTQDEIALKLNRIKVYLLHEYVYVSSYAMVNLERLQYKDDYYTAAMLITKLKEEVLNG